MLHGAKDQAGLISVFQNGMSKMQLMKSIDLNQRDHHYIPYSFRLTMVVISTTFNFWAYFLFENASGFNSRV